MPSNFDSMFTDAAECMADVFAERTPGGELDLKTYIDPRGIRRKVHMAISSERIAETYETEQGDVEGYTTKQRTQAVTVWHGPQPGQLPCRVELNGTFELSAKDGEGRDIVEEWAVNEIESADSVMTRLTLVFTQEINRGRSGVQ